MHLSSSLFKPEDKLHQEYGKFFICLIKHVAIYQHEIAWDNGELTPVVSYSEPDVPTVWEN